MVAPHRLWSPQYISALHGAYAATNDHTPWQDLKTHAGKLAEFKDLNAGRLAWLWACFFLFVCLVVCSRTPEAVDALPY